MQGFKRTAAAVVLAALMLQLVGCGTRISGTNGKELPEDTEQTEQQEEARQEGKVEKIREEVKERVPIPREVLEKVFTNAYESGQVMAEFWSEEECIVYELESINNTLSYYDEYIIPEDLEEQYRAWRPSTPAPEQQQPPVESTPTQTTPAQQTPQTPPAEQPPAPAEQPEQQTPPPAPSTPTDLSQYEGYTNPDSGKAIDPARLADFLALHPELTPEQAIEIAGWHLQVGFTEEELQEIEAQTKADMELWNKYFK